MTPFASTVLQYPVWLDVDYAERHSRWKALFRLVLGLPVLLFLYLFLYFAATGATLMMWLAILVRGRIPRWLFDFEVAINRFSFRALTYLLLLTDQYPAFDGEYPLRYHVVYPERIRRRQLVFWKLAAAMPQLVVFWVLQTTAGIITTIAWFVILFSGKYPRGLHDYVVGVMRWGARVQAYVLSLTDIYPPFSLEAAAGPASKVAYRWSAAGGAALISLLIAGIVAAVVVAPPGGQEVRQQVSYQRLLHGEPDLSPVVVHAASARLMAAVDPADDRYRFLSLPAGHRVVEFRLLVENRGGSGIENNTRLYLDRSDFSLLDASGHRDEAVLLVANREVAPAFIKRHQTVTVLAVFVLPAGTGPAELRWRIVNDFRFSGATQTIIYEFR